MAKKFFIRLVAVLLLVGLLFVQSSVALATAVDRTALCNLEGHPGENIETQITLAGIGAEERSGFWYTYYKEEEGDDERMDITSWITIEPEEYIITQGQSIAFTVRVKIPDDATPGLWGATSVEAGLQGHSAERRTYIIFKDTITGGNVYSGLLIPVSVKVLGETSPPTPSGPASPPAGETSQTTSAFDFIKDNIIVIVLGAVIVILLVLLLLRTRARKTG